MSEVPEFSKTGRRTTPRAWRCLRAAPVPISFEKALSAASMGGYGERAHTAGEKAYGGCPSFGVADVFETKQTETSPRSGLDSGEEKGFGQLELDRVSARNKPLDINGSL